MINIQLTFLDMFFLYILHGGIGVKSNSEDKARQYFSLTVAYKTYLGRSECVKTEIHRHSSYWNITIFTSYTLINGQAVFKIRHKFPKLK